MGGNSVKGAAFTQIREILGKLKMEYNAQFNVVIYSSIGKIVCDIEPLAKEDSLIGFTDDPTVFSVDISAIFDGKEMFSADLLNAKNVIVYSNSGEELMRVEQMVLFADQILGFNIVKKQV
jgi:hypothetical protein